MGRLVSEGWVVVSGRFVKRSRGPAQQLDEPDRTAARFWTVKVLDLRFVG
jgi:hypothetical protein